MGIVAHLESDSGAMDKPPKTSCFRKVLKALRNNKLTICILLSVFAGVGLGIGLRDRAEPWSHREIMYVGFLGEVYLRVLKSLVLPLIMSSVIASLGSLDMRVSGKIGLRALVYYLCTTPMAVILGIILVETIRPGDYGRSANDTQAQQHQAADGKPMMTTEDALLDLIRNLFTSNLVQSAFSQYRTVLTKPSPSTILAINSSDVINGTTVSINQSVPIVIPVTDWKISGSNTGETNILGIIVFAIALGISIGRMGEQNRYLLGFFQAMFSAIMTIVRWVIAISPIGIMFLIAGKVMEIENLAVVVAQLGLYFVTVVVGLILHGFVVVPLIYFATTRKSPYLFIFNQMESLITAFATSSSSATIPVTIRCLEDNNHVNPQVARFVLPIGVINLEGTALYEAVAALFIAQVRGVPLNVGQIVVVSITATFASMGAAGIPEAGLVTLVMVLNSVGLPPEDVSIIIIIDWILDRCRTMINVLSDAVAAGIVGHLSRDDLASLPTENVSSTDLQILGTTAHNDSLVTISTQI